MELFQFIFVLLSFLVVIVVYLYNKLNTLEKQLKLEKFSNNKIREEFTQEQSETIKNLINQQYDMDIEAIRNLGAISKSLLTGKNYHNTTGTTPGKLVIPADVEIQGTLNVKGLSTFDNQINLKGAIAFLSSTPGKYSKIWFNNNGAGSLEIKHWNHDKLRIYSDKTKGGIDIHPTSINSVGNGRVNFNSNVTMNHDLTVDSNLIVDGSATIGPAYIGEGKGWGSAWAEFSHKDRGNHNTKYSFLSGSGGDTRINTHTVGNGRRGIVICQDNDTSRGIIEYAISRPRAGFVPWSWSHFSQKLKNYSNRIKSGDKIHCLTNKEIRRHADLTLTAAKYKTDNRALVTYYSQNYKEHDYEWSWKTPAGVFDLTSQ